MCCEIGARIGGATPLCDCRNIYQKLPEGLRHRFESVGVFYRRAFGFDLGFSWSKAFALTSPQSMDQYCVRNKMRSQWIDKDKLIVTYRRWAALDHPITEERVWFNHGTFFNILSLTPEQRSFVIDAAGIDGAPYHTFFGDGALIECNDFATLRNTYESEIRTFGWEAGDLLLLDNMLVAHGRESYVGTRRVLVTMTERIACEQIAPPETYSLSDPEPHPDLCQLRLLAESK